MKLNDAYMDRRVQKDLNISEPMYLDGLLDITQILMIELEKLLDDENRRFGIMMSYLNSIFEAYKKSAPENESDLEILDKSLYLFKPAILKAYYQLRKRNLSKADSVIVILKRILEFITEYKTWEHVKNARTIHKIITKIFDNIRNIGKKAKLTYLTDYMKKYMELGLVGKYVLDHFSLEEEEARIEKKQMEGSGIKIDDNSKVGEVSWTEE